MGRSRYQAPAPASTSTPTSKETTRRGDMEPRRMGKPLFVTLSPCLPVTLSLCFPVSCSACLSISFMGSLSYLCLFPAEQRDRLRFQQRLPQNHRARRRGFDPPLSHSQVQNARADRRCTGSFGLG